jgi:hypothetical protein
MAYEDFEGFWRVSFSATNSECAVNSLITFVRTGGTDGKVTILCVKGSSPYGEGTAGYKEGQGDEVGTIEVEFEGKDYVISLNKEAKPPQIELKLKGSVPGQVTGSWTAEDYVPGSAPEPAGK